MTLISVITPVAVGAAAEHLSAAYASLTAQELPPNHQWEWVVQLDGDGELTLPEQAVHDPCVYPGHGPSGGAGLARNLALARSTGAIVVNLDADDQFTVGALGRIVNALIDSDIGWTTSAVVDLLPDGSQRRFDSDPPAGRLPRGSVTRYWRTHDWVLQVHPSTLAVRRDLLVAAGGWMGLPVSEDMGLLVVLDQTAHGAFIPEPGIVRRVHDGQMTQRPEHQSLVTQLRGLVWERAAALDPLNGTQKITPLHSEPEVSEDSSHRSVTSSDTAIELILLSQWPIRIVIAAALFHLGAYVGVVATAPGKWAEVLAEIGITMVVYAIFGWLAVVIRNRIRTDMAPTLR